MSTEILPAPVAPKPMSAAVRAFLGVGAAPAFVAICAAIVILWPVPSVDREALRKEKAQTDLVLATRRAIAQSAAPVDRDAAVAQEALAAKDAAEKAEALRKADEQFVPIAGGRFSIPREISYLLLAMVLGALGSFLQAARSFADYAGNRELGASWACWYMLQPFVGATLALFFYLVLRGGLLSGTASAADLSPHAVAAVSALVGMFSKQASDKLNEVFSLLLKTSADAPRKDPLVEAAPGPTTRQ